jgi:transposase-like protein
MRVRGGSSFACRGDGAEASAAMLSQGQGIAQVCQALEVSEQTFHRWRNQYGGMKADEADLLPKT